MGGQGAGSGVVDPTRNPALLVLPLALRAGCSDGCGNDVLSRAEDSDGARSAVTFQRSCGATTGFSTQISIVHPGEQPSGAGNAFRADDAWTEGEWLASDHLLIRYAEKSRGYEQNGEVSGIRISYRVVAR